MENKPTTKSADTTVRAAFALFQGAVVAMAYPLLFMVLPELAVSNSSLFLFLVIPLFGFFTSSFVNWFLQYMFCKSINVGKIFSGAAITPGLLIGFSGLAYWLPFLRKPVDQLLPELTPDATPDMRFAHDMWGYSFYLFWAGVYSQTLAAGMVAAC